MEMKNRWSLKNQAKNLFTSIVGWIDELAERWMNYQPTVVNFNTQMINNIQKCLSAVWLASSFKLNSLLRNCHRMTSGVSQPASRIVSHRKQHNLTLNNQKQQQQLQIVLCVINDKLASILQYKSQSGWLAGWLARQIWVSLALAQFNGCSNERHLELCGASQFCCFADADVSCCNDSRWSF